MLAVCELCVGIVYWLMPCKRYSRLWPSYRQAQLCLSGLVGLLFRRRPKPPGSILTTISYRTNVTTFAGICDETGERLFAMATHNTHQLLHRLPPPRRISHCCFRRRTRDLRLPDRSSELKDKNLLIRIEIQRRVRL